MSVWRRRLLVAAVTVALLGGCSRAPYMVVFNATGTTLTILRTPPYDADATIPPNTARRLRFPDAMRLAV
ncbi:MAG TPA: hypothetical protein VGJ70_26705, partial [Solirubrobacteraceae bacterium]